VRQTLDIKQISSSFVRLFKTTLLLLSERFRRPMDPDPRLVLDIIVLLRWDVYYGGGYSLARVVRGAAPLAPSATDTFGLSEVSASSFRGLDKVYVLNQKKNENLFTIALRHSPFPDCQQYMISHCSFTSNCEVALRISLKHRCMVCKSGFCLAFYVCWSPIRLYKVSDS
jgi:hypothetical protein